MRRRTVRVRLTAVYSGLFLLTSMALLVTMNLMLKENLDRRFAAVLPGIAQRPLAPAAPGACPIVLERRIAGDIKRVPEAIMNYQWGTAGIMVLVFTLLSVAAGWWLAGRFLRPVHRITATARRLSLSNLHERIGLTGPRDELTELASTFDSMLDRLEQSVDSQRRFIANASHELRTPLAIQRAAIQIGLDSPSPERLATIREELLEVNRRSERLIDGLLVLAQSEHGLETTEPVALDAVVEQAVAETPANGIEIRIDVEPVTVNGDPVLLHRLVANLLQNAVRYNRPEGAVDVRVTADGALTIRNTGPEVPDSRISELFEPFRRLHTARTGSSDGAGLGLSIVATIARAHGAEVTARPNPGGGLELTVRFPAG